MGQLPRFIPNVSLAGNWQTPIKGSLDNLETVPLMLEPHTAQLLSQQAAPSSPISIASTISLPTSWIDEIYKECPERKPARKHKRKGSAGGPEQSTVPSQKEAPEPIKGCAAADADVVALQKEASVPIKGCAADEPADADVRQPAVATQTKASELIEGRAAGELADASVEPSGDELPNLLNLEAGGDGQ